jgi:hypothetical protein
MDFNESIGDFTIQCDARGISSLKRTRDVFDTDYIQEGEVLGDAIIRYRLIKEEWRVVQPVPWWGSMPWLDTRAAEIAPLAEVTPSREGTRVLEGRGKDPRGWFECSRRMCVDDESLVWAWDIRNLSSQQLQVGDLALPLLFNTQYVFMDTETTYEKRVIKQSFVSGHGSYIFWTRSNGVGPFLVMTPMGDAKLEFFQLLQPNAGQWEGPYLAYIHSACLGGLDERGTWRQPHTSATLAPAGTTGDSVSYAFKFRWAKDFPDVRDVLWEEGLFDIQAAPGMVVPSDLSTRFRIRTKNRIDSIEPEFPGETTLKRLDDGAGDTCVYEALFSRLGENLITLRYDHGKYMVLEFFITEPLETIVKKRASFITAKQQTRAPGQWYDGVFGLWDMRDGIYRDPRNPGPLTISIRKDPYMVSGVDDVGTSKPSYLSEKNVAFPDPKEIEALEYFIEHYVWGNHQRTDEERPHPYGIYGTCGDGSWHGNRTSKIGFNSYGLGQEHLWRTYDYTHYFQLYYNLYLIAKANPGMVRYLDARGYLRRAYGTARAFFEVTYNIEMGRPPWHHAGWCDWAYKMGHHHGRYIVLILEALEREEMNEEARWLRAEWEKKVKYFLYDAKYAYATEMAWGDSAIFDEIHAIAKYACEVRMQPDTNLWQDKNTKRWYSHPSIKDEDAVRFMETETRVNVASQGQVPAYYLLGGSIGSSGSAYYALSYNSQLGGWGILDYALYNAKDPFEYLRLGYASILSSWALMNTGTPRSHYGYWFPGKKNDGAVGWAFEAVKYGPTWGIGDIPRGAWWTDGEIDHGLVEGVKSAATIVVNDPLFGLMAFGGRLQKRRGGVTIVPCDGVRQRFHAITENGRLHVILQHCGFAKGRRISIRDDLDSVAFSLESRGEGKNQCSMSVRGLRKGSYRVLVDGSIKQSLLVEDEQEWHQIALSVTPERHNLVEITKK